MKVQISYEEALALACETVCSVEMERIPLERCAGRVLAQNVLAEESVPAFDRSPYDGYALRTEDVREACAERPVKLRVLEAIPAGGAPPGRVEPGTAVKVLTGAPIPAGADTVIKYEDTRFTLDTVELMAPLKSGANIVRAGEDVKTGERLAGPGEVLDGPLMGVLAAQRLAEPLVYRRPRVGLITTGSELLSLAEPAAPGKIVDTSRFTLAGALERMGCESLWLGWAGDDIQAICALIRKGLSDCDALLLTGGVSAGDYDLTPPLPGGGL